MSVKQSNSWEEMLQESCNEKYQEKLIVDLLYLFKQDIDQSNPVQLAVIRNLVGKLRGSVNHQYLPLMKTIGKPHKIRLGETNYDLLKVCCMCCDHIHYNMYMSSSSLLYTCSSSLLFSHFPYLSKF